VNEESWVSEVKKMLKFHPVTDPEGQKLR